MREPPTPADEKDRIESLHALGILDSPPEERFDRITRLAIQIFDVPIALVSLVDSDRQWFKSCQGLDVSETARGISFCGHAILAQDVLVIEDAAADARFADNPLVTGGPRIRFYAGAPLVLQSGHAAGTLCIISPQPRSFTARDRATIKELASIVLAELENVYTAANERELRDFVDSAGAIIQSVDEQGHLRMVNRAWLAALGYSREEAVGRSVFDVLAPGEREHCREILAGLASSDSPIRIEADFIAKDGRKVRLSGMLSALRRPNGTMATRGVFQDVTAQRELDRVRTEITHHVSHELKTPLAVTSLALKMLAESEDAPSALRHQFLGIAQRGAAQLSRMIEDLLDVSRSETGKLRVEPAPGDLNELLAVIGDSFKPLAARHGLKLSVEPAPPGTRAVFDPVRLRQIFSNLIGNALKFTPAGGHVSIDVQENPDGFIELRVRDTGVGIGQDDAKRIFDRLYQTSNKVRQGEPGLGIGLHICRELVAAHGGRIWVESEVGKGTVFRFTLRRAD